MFEFSESEEIEFKSSFNNDTITRAIVAFLNAHGGRIYIGANNDKTIYGVRSVDEMQRKISGIITNQIEPLPTNLIKTAILTSKMKSIFRNLGYDESKIDEFLKTEVKDV